MHKLFYVPALNIETSVPDPSPNPFDLLYEHELISHIEKKLAPEEWPYWEALLAGERPRQVAARLGVHRKLALNGGAIIDHKAPCKRRFVAVEK